MKTKYIAKALLFNGGKVLLMRRSSTAPYRPGEWDLPGGKVEDGEMYSEGCVREIKEEAGVTILPENLELLFTTTEFYEDKNLSVIRFVYIGKTENDKVTLSREHDAFKWVSLEQAIDMFDHTTYRQAMKYLRKHGD